MGKKLDSSVLQQRYFLTREKSAGLSAAAESCLSAAEEGSYVRGRLK